MDNETASLIISFISLGISFAVGIWALRFNWKNRKSNEETKKTLEEHSEILRNSRA
jgi:hypothetical protein